MIIIDTVSTHTHFIYLDKVVELHQLTFVELKGKKFRVIKEVQKDWRQVGSILELESADINNQDMGVGKEYESCRRIFDIWLKGRGRKSKTWESVIFVLDALGLGELGDDLKRCLQQ